MVARSKVIRQLRGGQITIPIEFRRELAIGDDTLLQISVDGSELRLSPVRVERTETGTEWLQELYDRFAPVRDQISEAGYSEDEVNADLEAALRAVRSERD